MPVLDLTEERGDLRLGEVATRALELLGSSTRHILARPYDQFEDVVVKNIIATGLAQGEPEMDLQGATCATSK